MLASKCVWFDKHPCFVALQETNNTKMDEMKIKEFVVHRRDGRLTAIFVPEKLQRNKQSWIHHDKCTALLVKSILLLSVHLPHDGYDEEEYVIVMATIQNVKRAKKIMIGGDLNIELGLGEEGGNDWVQGRE